MIFFIAAIDLKRGLADDDGIPWDLPTDKQYFRSKTLNKKILMGYRTYQEFDKPWDSRINYVAVRPGTKLREGFIAVEDSKKFLTEASGDIWVIGGAGLFGETIELADVLYLTEIQADFNCSKFFPEFKDKFALAESSDPITENNITFTFNKYIKKR